MELQITGKNIELTPAIRGYAERKLEKLERLLPKITEFKAEITEEKTRSPQERFVVGVTVSGAGTRFHSEERGGDLFKAIDKVNSTMKRQLTDYKGKLYDKGRGTSLARGGTPPGEGKPKPPAVVKVKRFTVKPMTPATAIEQMEQMGHDFFLFFDAEEEEMHLLYRRKDGDYGIIQPELD